MKYRIEVLPKSNKQIQSLSPQIQKRIRVEIRSLADDPRPDGCKKLKGLEAYRVRVGDYRILYQIKDEILTVTVIKVGHRSDIYE